MSPKLIETAKRIRRKCQSGYDWNVPKHWDDLPQTARDIWIGRAIRETLEETSETAQ